MIPLVHSTLEEENVIHYMYIHMLAMEQELKQGFIQKSMVTRKQIIILLQNQIVKNA